MLRRLRQQLFVDRGPISMRLTAPVHGSRVSVEARTKDYRIAGRVWR
jgi:hypothetical protein